MSKITTAVFFCSCANEGQDKMYGSQKRVHNATTKVNPQIYRCTVCGKESQRK